MEPLGEVLASGHPQAPGRLPAGLEEGRQPGSRLRKGVLGRASHCGAKAASYASPFVCSFLCLTYVENYI